MEPININADDEDYEALKAHQDKYLKGSDIQNDSLSFPIGSTVVIQGEDGGPWIYCIIVETNNIDHNGQSYIIIVTKVGRLITNNMKHTSRTFLMMKQYLCEQR